MSSTVGFERKGADFSEDGDFPEFDEEFDKEFVGANVGVDIGAICVTETIADCDAKNCNFV